MKRKTYFPLENDTFNLFIKEEKQSDAIFYKYEKSYSKNIYCKFLLLFFCMFLSVISNTIYAQEITPNFINTDVYASNTSSVTVNMPSGSVIGDLIFINIVTDDDGNMTAPAEFTQIYMFFQGSRGPTIGLYYRIIDGTEAATYNFTFPPEPAVVTVLRYDNSDIISTNPFDVMANSSGNNNNPLAPSVTTTGDNKTILQFVGVDGASAGVLSSNTASNTVLATAQSGNSGGCEMMIASGYQEFAGATPQGSYSFANEQWTTISLALNQIVKTITLTGTTGTNCSASSSISFTYEVPGTTGNFELLDPLGNVVSTQAYTTSTGSITFNFTASISGDYQVRNQTYTNLTLSAGFYVDTDGDSVCDDVDIDSDNDGITNAVENGICAQVDYNILANKQNIIITKTAGTGGSQSSNPGVLIDGGTTATNFWYLDANITGLELVRLQFPNPTALSGLEYYIGNSYMLNTGCQTKIQASNDGNTWVDVSPVYTKSRPPNNTPGVLSTAPYAETFLWTNTTPYKIYRHIGVSGNANQNPYVYEIYFRTEIVTFCDWDGDGLSNDIDLDSDNDGIPDNVEGQPTLTYVPPNGDSQATYLSNNGINSAYIGGIMNLPDTDSDACADWLDTDSDNDGDLDKIESGLTFNNVPGLNGLDSGSETTDDYSDANGIINDPKNDLASENPGVSEVYYRFKAPAIPVKVCYTSHNYNIGGSQFTFADDKLLNLANFGEDGTSRFEFSLYSFGTSTVTEAALVANGCQIFQTGNSNEFNATEIAEITSWTADSNHVMITSQSLIPSFGGSGYASSNGNTNPNMLTTLGESIINGPFGTVGAFNQGGSYQGTFTAFPAASSCVIVEDNIGRPSAVINNITGDFYFADADLISELGGLTNNNGISSSTDIFFANLYHSAATLAVAGASNPCDFFTCIVAGSNAPMLSSTTVASSGTVDLTLITASNKPNGTNLTWHTAIPATNANKILTPEAYTGTGDVYGIFYSPADDCYAGNGNLTTTVTIVTLSSADLSLAIAPLTQTGNEGEMVSYTVTITNNGPDIAENVEAKVDIPLTLEVLLSIPSKGAYNTTTQMWSIPNLPVGNETLTITYKVK